MIKALLFAGLAAFGNAVFVYGQRGSSPSTNPFLFILGAVSVCTLLFLPATWLFRSPGDVSFLLANVRCILLSGVGFFITFVGFYFLYSQFGASHYIVYAVLSILTTSIGVGVFLYREPFNLYHAASMVLAVAAIALFSYGQIRAAG